MNDILRSFLTALAILLAILTVTVGLIAPKLQRNVAGNPEHELGQALTYAPAKRLVLQHTDGSITIETADIEQMQVQVNARIYARGWLLGKLAREYAASMLASDETPDQVLIITEPGDRPDELQVFADYRVIVPPGTDLDLTVGVGNITIGPGCGAIALRARSSDIVIEAPLGTVFAETVNGRIEAHTLADAADLETENGDIRASTAGRTLNARTGDGAIIAQILQPTVTRAYLNTRNGDIKVSLAEGCSAEVEALTERGQVTAEYPVDARHGVEKRRKIVGTIGAGTTELSMRAMNGNIHIARSTS